MMVPPGMAIERRQQTAFVRFVSYWAWLLLPGLVLVTAYVAICVKTANPLPLLEVVHESGNRTLLGTVFYFEHATRELLLDLILGVAIGGSAFIAFPCGKSAYRFGSRRRTGYAIALVVVCGVIIGGTVHLEGISVLLDNLFQKHTRPGAPLAWGAHWRYHLLSRAMVICVSFGFAGVLVRIACGRRGRSHRLGQSICLASAGVYGLFTLVFLPNLDPFRDPLFLGHQVREAFTHLLVTVPVGWAACAGAADAYVLAAPNRGHSTAWSLISGGVGLLIGVYILVGGLITSAVSEGQSASLTMLLCPHFFEHSFTFVVVPLAAALVYESAVAAAGYVDS